MEAGNQYEGIDTSTLRLVQRKARQLVGKAGFVEADREDLEQELILDLMRRLPHFDPARGVQRSTFIARIVDHCVATLIESQKAGMRDYRLRAVSIDAESAQLDELTVDGEEQLGRKLDVTNVLREMSENDRALCKRLMHQTVSQIARETSTPRTTIHDAKARIRRRFERAGLREYV